MKRLIIYLCTYNAKLRFTFTMFVNDLYTMICCEPCECGLCKGLVRDAYSKKLADAFTGFTATNRYLVGYKRCEGESNLCKTSYKHVFTGREL